MISCARNKEPLARLNNFTFTRDELFDVVDRIVKAKDAKDRLKIPGIDPRRVDIIVAGALILEQGFKELKIREMTVSEFALREGIVFDTIEKKHRKTHGHALNDIRYGSVLHLAENFGYEREHSHHVAHLALRIFDETKRLHRLGKTEREYLEAAAILHEIGLSISHSQHHLHSYYLVRNADLLGFTENEKEIIANIARYHRKSHPKDKHSGIQNLSAEERSLVAQLASILRIADGLDRTHSSVIADLKGKMRKNSLQIRLKKKKGFPTDLELWGANRKKELFENTFKREVKFSLA
jgi:exopolyphosphatase/guanosine-5'-triphosphate,3'-diphosphate pyrophosphatase